MIPSILVEYQELADTVGYSWTHALTSECPLQEFLIP